MKPPNYSRVKPSRFGTLIRIDPVQKLWVQKHKDTRTDAGFLDKIINFYKKHHDGTDRGISIYSPEEAGDAKHSLVQDDEREADSGVRALRQPHVQAHQATLHRNGQAGGEVAARPHQATVPGRVEGQQPGDAVVGTEEV